MKFFLKKLCILLLSGGTLLLSARFPDIAAQLQDLGANREPRFAAVTSVLPEIQLPLSIPAKLTLLSQGGRGIELSEEETVMTISHARSAAEKAFAPYHTVQLILPIEDYYSYFRPLLIQDPDFPERHCIVWEGCYIHNSAPYSVINILLDDETGNILRLHYDAGEYLFAQSSLGENLNAFAEIFFNALGIRDYEKNLLGDPYYSEDICRIQYRIHVPEYGDVTLDFVSLASAFYVTFL